LNAQTRAILAASIAYAIQLVVWTVVLYFIRRRGYPYQHGSWLQNFLAYLLLSVLVTGTCLIPEGGSLLALPLAFVGLKKLSGLGLLETFCLAVGVGIPLLCIYLMIGAGLGVKMFGP
jgi:hypothetical protein